jgi:hypothetical protein
MTNSIRSPSKTYSDRADFSKLVALRKEWRSFHEKQDRENADRVFRQAGIELVTDLDLKFFPALFREKLNEFGRDWERTLAARALREGFSFYRLQLIISVSEVTTFHSALETKLASNGAALFFESNGLSSLDDGKWDAVFYFTLRPGTEVESLDIEKLPGVINVAKVLKIA